MCIRDRAYRVLKKGGRFFCLEFSKIQNKNLEFIYKKYSKLIPLIGKYVVGQREPYDYLIESIDNFVNQEELLEYMKMNKFQKSALSAFCSGMLLATSLAADTIKVGVLHSLSGTLAISETTLKDTVEFLIEEQNKKGGVLGKQLQAVVVDPASDWPLFAEKARGLIEKDKVDVIFGCWTSVSRKSVLPVIEELNSVFFYPVQYEGEESSKNVFYTGAAPRDWIPLENRK